MDEITVGVSYTMPESLKERIEREAKAQDLKASQLVRRIINGYFATLDAKPDSPNPTEKLNSTMPVAA
jgi:hypothetical protein